MINRRARILSHDMDGSNFEHCVAWLESIWISIRFNASLTILRHIFLFH